ncbi:MAG TPA: hypothetical protein VNS32_29305 [Flavisolibacter sp.]|nr:hypothetical protein [Flavisolibacter sp.]
MLQPDNLNLYHPETEDEIIDLILHAIDNKLQVRVRGAAQSVSQSVFTDGYTATPASNGNINII